VSIRLAAITGGSSYRNQLCGVAQKASTLVPHFLQNGGSNVIPKQVFPPRAVGLALIESGNFHLNIQAPAFGHCGHFSFRLL